MGDISHRELRGLMNGFAQLTPTGKNRFHGGVSSANPLAAVCTTLTDLKAPFARIIPISLVISLERIVKSRYHTDAARDTNRD